MKRPLRLASNFLLILAERNQHKWVASLILVFSFPFRRFTLVRRLVNSAQPVDPLSNETDLPNIELVMAVAEKDFSTAVVSIESAKKNCANHIERVVVVVPTQNVREARRVFRGTMVIDEKKFLPPEMNSTIITHHPDGREGWIRQQVIGLYFARQSQMSGVLVLDADTVFLRPFSLLTKKGVQLIQLSVEYVHQYEKHARLIWGRRRRHLGLSYVTHYQLMQPQVVKEMFPKDVDLIEWIQASDVSFKSPIADYHCYGRFLVERFPKKYRLGIWKNKAVKRPRDLSLNPEQAVNGALEAFRGYSSVSFHSYLDNQAGPAGKSDGLAG